MENKPRLETLICMVEKGKATDLVDLSREFRLYTTCESFNWNEASAYGIMAVRYYPGCEMELENRNHRVYDDLKCVVNRLKKYYDGKIGPNHMWTSTIKPYTNIYNFKYGQLLDQVINFNQPITPMIMK